METKRGCDISSWVKQVEEARPRMNAILEEFAKVKGIHVERGDPRELAALPYIVTIFPPGSAEGTRVTIFIDLMDWQTDSDVVITNMTTLPEVERGKGAGSYSLAVLLNWAHRNNLHKVRATQVHRDSERFWLMNDFVKDDPPNPCNDFIWKG